MQGINPVSSPCAAAAAASCTEIDWEISSHWSVQATFYSDDDCNDANGETSDIPMSEFMEMYDVPNGCNSSDGHVAAIRCINGDLGLAMYGDSDTTCSLDPEMASTDLFGCQSSTDEISDLGAYLQTDCTPTPSSDGSVAYTYFFSWSVAAAAAATALATALA